MNTSIRYSVVLPTYNRVPDLKTILESLVVQTAKDFEVIIVDDASDGDTRVFCENFIAHHSQIPIQFVRLEKNGGHGRARNAGTAVARGQIVLFTDDDCVVPTDWIKEHAEAHARYPDAVGVGGWYWSGSSTRKKNRFDRYFELQFEDDFPHMRDVEVWTNTMHSPSGNTANMSYKVAAFKALGGFDERIYFSGGIDWELKTRCIASGYSLVFIPLVVQHEKLFTIKTFLSKHIKLGRGTDYMAAKYRSRPRPTLAGALSTYVHWKTSVVIRGECADVALLCSLAFLLGKYINRILGFKPTEVFDMRSFKYFTYRYKNGTRISMHEIRKFELEASAGSFEVTLRGADASVRYSVIIPTFNRKEYLAVAIEAVLSQERVPAQLYELVVVDDGSTDGTKEAVEAIIAAQPGRAIRYLYQPNAGASAARNAGAAAASGSILFFTDSDCRVPKRWLWNMLQAYEQYPEIVGTGGGQLTRRKGATRLDHFRATASDNQFVATYREAIIISDDTVAGVVAYDSASMSIRTEVFKEVGGFYPVGNRVVGFYHEDVDLACRVQRRGPMALVPDTFAMNRRLLSFADFRNVAYVRGATLPYLIDRIAPAATAVCERPLRIQVFITFLLCLMRPFNISGWLWLVNLERYAAGYRQGLAVQARERDFSVEETKTAKSTR